LRTLRRSVLGITLGVAAVLGVGSGVLVAALGETGAGLSIVGVSVVVLLAIGALSWRLIDRNYLAWGYAERDEDLLVVRGWLFRRMVVVPYGRMQFVDVSAGPLERRFDLATVQLHTAAAASDARIPGLPPDEAHRLRDTLARLGEARSAGL
jgi:membrane protein YdbS with pleckstrin-like domain